MPMEFEWDENKAKSNRVKHGIRFEDAVLLFDDPGNDSNLLIVFYVQIMPDDLVMQLHRF